MAVHTSIITIDLSNSDNDNIKLKPEELIHQQAYDRMNITIHDHLKKFDKSNKDILKQHSNLSLFIDGTRGAGKSTFLKNTVNSIISNPNLKIKKLIYIDPTKIEIGEHIFLTLIAQINKMVNEAKSRSFKDNDDTYQNYEEWRKKLKKLAGGLRLLNGTKSVYDQIDDDVFLDWGLDRADDGMQLGKQFEDLIIHSCTMLNIDAFIIAIDDADTHFKKGEQVLEMIRRYLDTPRIILIMTGDLQLYSHLVRGLYIGNMGDDLYKYDSSRSKERGILLDHMEDQYLKKLFPIKNRILLQPLVELIKHTKYEIKINDNQTVAIDKLFNSLIEQGLHIKTSSDRATYLAFILQQPLRSILQLLQATANISTSDRSQYAITSYIAKAFRDVSMSSLFAAKVSVDGLNNGDKNALIEGVFNTVIREGEQDTGCYLRPQASDEMLRSSFVALSSTVAEFTQGKASCAINYMLQGPGSVSLFYYLRDDSKDYLKDYSHEQRLQLFKNYCGIGHNEDALNWAWHACGVLMGKNIARAVKFGIVGFKLYAPRAPKGLTYDGITANKLIKTNKKETLPLTLGLIEVIHGAREQFFSIFNILGVIARLLAIVELYDIDEKIDPNNLEFDVRECLRKLEVPLGISAPNWFDPLSRKSPDTDSVTEANREKDESVDQEDPNLQPWVQAICIWLCDSHRLLKDLYPSSVMLGKIWMRLYFSLTGVADSLQAVGKAGDIIALYTHCLINAFLVEEADHHYCKNDTQDSKDIKQRISRTNPQVSFNVVAKKIDQLKSIDFVGFPFTKIIVHCPLIRGLLPEDPLKDKAISSFVANLPEDTNKIFIAYTDSKLYRIKYFGLSKRELLELKAQNENLIQVVEKRKSLNIKKHSEKVKVINGSLESETSNLALKKEIEGLKNQIEHNENLLFKYKSDLVEINQALDQLTDIESKDLKSVDGEG